MVGLWVTRSPCSRRMYMRASPSSGPQVGRCRLAGLAGRERREQFTLRSAIICMTVLRQPGRV